MFEEMERFGLRPPVYAVTEGSVRVTLYKQPDEERRLRAERVTTTISMLTKRMGEGNLSRLLEALKQREGLASGEIAGLVGVSIPTARNYMKMLEEVGLVTRKLKSANDPTSVWIITDSIFWR
jgi:predicted HTH transcriptional regulator